MISSFFKKLLLTRQIDIDNGEFKLFNKNFLLSSVESVMALRNILKEHKKTEVLYEYGKEISLEIIDHFNKFKGKKEDSIKFWLNMINISGFGSIDIVESRKEKSAAIINCKNSPIAIAYMKEKKKDKVDEILSGIIAAFFSYWFEKEVVCEEVACIADGDRYCQFKVSQQK